MRRAGRTGRLLAAALLVAWGVPARAGTLIDQNARVTAAYVLMQANMVDAGTFFQRYAIPAEVEVRRHGGQALIGSHARQEIEGRWNGNWTLLLRFPSMADVGRWYHSAGYQAVVPYRHQATSWGNMVAIEGLPESSLKWEVDRWEGATAALSLPATLDTSPEYVVTTRIDWGREFGRVALACRFAPVELAGSSLRVALSATSDQPASTLILTPTLRDVTGRRWTLPSRIWRPVADGRWQTFDWSLGGPEPQQAPPADAPVAAAIQSIEFELARPPSGQAQTLQVSIKNLLVRRPRSRRVHQ